MLKCGTCYKPIEKCACVNALGLPQEDDSRRVAALRRIVQAHRCYQVDGCSVKAWEAETYLRVWDALSRYQRGRMDSRPFGEALSLAWTLTSLGNPG